MNQSILEKIFNKIPPIMVYACETIESHGCHLCYEDIKETFKILTKQQNHEIDLCKKYLQNTLRRKGK